LHFATHPHLQSAVKTRITRARDVDALARGHKIRSFQCVSQNVAESFSSSCIELLIGLTWRCDTEVCEQSLKDTRFQVKKRESHREIISGLPIQPTSFKIEDLLGQGCKGSWKSKPRENLLLSEPSKDELVHARECALSSHRFRRRDRSSGFSLSFHVVI
jgi:hypothetical protein